jgi:transposase
MFFPESTLRVHVYGEPVDMRKSFDGLYALVRHRLALDPLSGALFVFINRRSSQMKVLYWDRTGFCVWAKRLERGTFVSDWSTMHTREIDWTQLKLMLEGLVVRAKKYRYQHPESARKAA